MAPHTAAICVGSQPAPVQNGRSVSTDWYGGCGTTWHKAYQLGPLSTCENGHLRSKLINQGLLAGAAHAAHKQCNTKKIPITAESIGI